MIKIGKLTVIFLIFGLLFASQVKASNLILPKSKPAIDEEIKKITLILPRYFIKFDELLFLNYVIKIYV